MRGVVSPDAGEREHRLRDLSNQANRRHETWVVEGLGLLNHPLRADTSAALVPQELDMLWDVHRTGGLFFDANWANSVLRGHSSPQVAAAVTHFIDTLPADYPQDLRAKVLQSSDMLMRAARLGGH